MEKKASINKPLMIIAAVLSGVGAIFYLSDMIKSMQWEYYFDNPLHLILDVVRLLSFLAFVIVSVLSALKMISFKLFVVPLSIYFIPIIIINLINIVTYFPGFFRNWLNIAEWVIIGVVLILTILEFIRTKIPALILSGIYIFLLLLDLFRNSYLFIYTFSAILHWSAMLLLVIALPANKKKIEAGELLEEQNLALCIVLSIVTCGIYGLVWKYQLCRKIRLLNDESTDCVGEYLCLILVPFYHLYWYYTRGQNLYQGMKKVGAPASDNSVVNLVLALFGFSIVSDALIQNDLNKAAGVLQVRSRTVSVEAENSVSGDEEDAAQTEEPSEDKAEPADENMALLQQLAELHDKGILSDEEFETKKKDLLDRI